jgi:hypothetical protein
VSELRAIRAWTARGRTPRVAERASPSFAWALMRTRDGGPDEPPEHASRLELARRVVVFFCNWPRDDEDAEREREALVTVPRVPTRDELRGGRRSDRARGERRVRRCDLAARAGLPEP